MELAGLQFFHVVYVVVDAEDGDTHLSAVAGRVGADDAAVAGCGDGRVLDDGERLGGCVGFRHVELEVALAVTLHLDVDFGRTVAPHECLGLAEQGQRVALLAVEVDAVFLAAHLEVIAVDVSREVGRVGHEVDAQVVVCRRIERQAYVQLPARAVGCRERGGETSRSGLVACVVEPDEAVVFDAEFLRLAVP